MINHFVAQAIFATMDI
jgi:uracil-DNA glycosylase family 4